MTVIAWYSTYVVEPVVQSVILVERSPVTETPERAEEINSSTVEEVRQAVTQFLQQQQHSSENSSEHLQEQQQAASHHQEEEVGKVFQYFQILLEMFSLILSLQANNDSAEVDEAETVRIPEEERVTVRLKFLNDTLKDVEASLVENVGQFKRRNFSQEISSNKNVRLIFNGQVLRDEASSLRQCGIFDKCVVHCLIHNGPVQANSNSNNTGGLAAGLNNNNNTQQRDLDLSVYFIPILGLALALLWYFALVYNAYFNFLSTSALIGLTSLYFLSVYGTHFHVALAVRT